MEERIKKSLAKGKAPCAVFTKEYILIFDKKGKLRIRFGAQGK